MLKKLLESTSQATIGGRFKGICVVGLNKVEFLPAGSNDAINGDSWKDVTDEHSRKRMALVFFAPRELDGSPTNPYEFLCDDPEDIEAMALLEHNLNHVPLVDMCRVSPAEPGKLNIIVVADVMFHWDVNDSYVIPTTKYDWVRDITQIIKSYPKAIEVTIYTNWNSDQITESNILTKPLKHIPLDEKTWLNTPSFQDKHGLKVLLSSLIIAVLAWGVIHLQGTRIDKLGETIRITQQRIPREGRFIELSRFMLEQEKFMKYREIYPHLVNDIAKAIDDSKMSIDNFEIRNPTPTEPNNYMIASIEAKKGTYKGWLQEEPIAKDILISSATISAVRKPPGNIFKLEGLIDLVSNNKIFEQESIKLKQATKAGSKEKLVSKDTTTPIKVEEPK